MKIHEYQGKEIFRRYEAKEGKERNKQGEKRKISNQRNIKKI